MDPSRPPWFAVTALCIVIFLAVSCSDAAVDDASDTTSTTAGSARPSEQAPAAEDAQNVVDLTGVAVADAELANSLVEFASLGDERRLSPGPWFSSGFSQSLAFELPVAARIIEIGRGSVLLEVGDSGSSDHGLLHIVEAVAFASPAGPVPISTIDPDSEFSDTAELDRGIGRTVGEDLYWRDVIVDSGAVPEMFHAPCRAGDDLTCVAGPISEGGDVGVVMDVPLRFVSQSFESRRLYVIATDLAGDDRGDRAPVVFDHALDLAASLTATDRVDAVGRQPLALIANRSGAISPGTWYAELDGVDVDFEIADEIPDVRVDSQSNRFVAFEFSSPDGQRSYFFSVQVFQGFVDGVLSEELAGTARPLPTETYLAGIEALVGVASSDPSSIGGVESTVYTTADVPLESPFACPPFARPAYLDADDGCVLYSVDGWMLLDAGDDPVVHEAHYIEAVGAVVYIPGTDGPDGFEPIEDVQPLLDGLEISARQ